MIKKYVITGGPGCGKTSVITGLELNGKYVVREVSETIISFEKALGNLEPWTKAKFQEDIIKLQLQRESLISKEVKEVFLDRGIFDNLAYCIQLNQPVPKILKEYEENPKNANYMPLVFLLEPLSHWDNNNVRYENLEISKKISDLIEQVYINLGFEIVKVPPMPLKERVDFILNKIKKEN
jgi:predicted ATPase